jgi:hypothetical protein
MSHAASEKDVSLDHHEEQHAMTSMFANAQIATGQ